MHAYRTAGLAVWSTRVPETARHALSGCINLLNMFLQNYQQHSIQTYKTAAIYFFTENYYKQQINRGHCYLIQLIMTLYKPFLAHFHSCNTSMNSDTRHKWVSKLPSFFNYLYIIDIIYPYKPFTKRVFLARLF